MAGFSFLNNFYYGKAGQGDFTPEQLPKNRVALFFSVLRIRFSSMVALNLLYAAFLIPAIVWTAIYWMTLIQAPAAAETTQAVLDGNLLIYLLGMIPCQMLAGVASPGQMYVLRNWARDQHAFLWSDFKEQTRANWKAGLLTGFLNGLSIPIAYVCSRFYGAMARSGVWWMAPQVLVIMLCALWWMMNMVIFPGMVTYTLRYRDLLRNSAIMVIARLPWSILLLAGTVGVPAAILLTSGYGVLIVGAAFLLIGFSLNGLIYASYANSCFDKYLNPRIAGAQVNRGLRPDDEQEDGQE